MKVCINTQNLWHYRGNIFSQRHWPCMKLTWFWSELNSLYFIAFEWEMGQISFAKRVLHWIKIVNWGCTVFLLLFCLASTIVACQWSKAHFGFSVERCSSPGHHGQNRMRWGHQQLAGRGNRDIVGHCSGKVRLRGRTRQADQGFTLFNIPRMLANWPWWWWWHRVLPWSSE